MKEKKSLNYEQAVKSEHSEHNREKMLQHSMLRHFSMSAILVLVVELCSQRSLIGLLKFVFLRPHLYLLNILIVCWTFSWRILVRRKDFLDVLVSVIWLVLGAVNLFLLSCRVTPFNAADIRLTKDAFVIAGKYLRWWMVAGIVLAAVVIITVLIMLWIRLKKSAERPHYVRGFITVAASFFALIGVCSGGLALGLLPRQFGNLAQAYLDYGFVYCFSNSVINTGISKPSSYSAEGVQEIEEEIAPEQMPDTFTVIETKKAVADTQGIAVSKETPNIIFLQLESFSDPTKYLHVACSEDPIPNFHQLMQEYPSGYLNVPAVGAGTANTEFETMTGINMDFFGPGEYPYKTVLQKQVCESIGFDLKELGYHAHAIHNNSGTFYDRYRVFAQLGFDTFTSIEYMSRYPLTPTGWAKDEILTEQIKNVLDTTTGADLIYTISVQGHGAYPTEPLIADPAITVTGLEDEGEKNAMEYYVNQIHEMDQFVRKLTDYLAERDEPTILVFYGDHLPSLNLTDDVLENGDQFQTEYIIWNNIGLEQKRIDLEAYQLAAHVLAEAGIQTGTIFRFHQSWLNEEHSMEEEEKYQEDLQVLAYDILYGDQDVFDGEERFEATQLHMGVLPISISQVTYQNGGLYVFGWNFTEHSEIFLNEEQLETQFVTPNMLYASISEMEDQNAVSVAQVSEDNIVLSTTEPFQLPERLYITNG